jgi:uncharacterized membrane protein/protein-disulfide isomerase
MRNTLPYNYYVFPVFLLTFLGIADTSYLAVSHYKNYTDIAYASFCALSQTINCDTVAQSSWSIIFGIPVALWGLAGYLLYFSLLIHVRKHTVERLPLWTFLQLLGLLYSLLSIFLGYISAEKIHSYCLMCFLSYGISFLLFYFPLMIRNRFYKKSFVAGIKEAIPVIKKSLFLKAALATLFAWTIGLLVFLPHYWIHEYPADFSKVATGLTEDGHPWIGARHPQLTIEEFTDYQCFQCGKLHYFLRKLVDQYPETIKLIHRNYPLDHRYNPILSGKPFHVGSGEMALLAIYASSQGKFWEMNDELYKLVQTSRSKPLDLKALGEKLSLPETELQSALHSLVILNKLRVDIQSGIKSSITATPSYIINDQVFIGSIPASVFQGIKP